MLALVNEPGGGGARDEGRLSRLPPGRHGLPREFVARSQRERLAAGTIAAVAAHGYHKATITEIAAASGVSRRTFYTIFESKAECFFDTYDMIADHVRREAAAAAAREADWPGRVRARLRVTLEIFSQNPDLARFVLIAPQRAGSEISERYQRGMAEILSELTHGMPKEAAARAPSQAAEMTLIGGGAALIIRKVEAGEGERLIDLLPDLLELTLTPFLGRAEAARLAREAD
jgi:AcrR family transcriptional regulator